MMVTVSLTSNGTKKHRNFEVVGRSRSLSRYRSAHAFETRRGLVLVFLDCPSDRTDVLKVFQESGDTFRWHTADGRLRVVGLPGFGRRGIETEKLSDSAILILWSALEGR